MLKGIYIYMLLKKKDSNVLNLKGFILINKTVCISCRNNKIQFVIDGLGFWVL